MQEQTPSCAIPVFQRPLSALFSGPQSSVRNLLIRGGSFDREGLRETGRIQVVLTIKTPACSATKKPNKRVRDGGSRGAR